MGRQYSRGTLEWPRGTVALRTGVAKTIECFNWVSAKGGRQWYRVGIAKIFHRAWVFKAEGVTIVMCALRKC